MRSAIALANALSRLPVDQLATVISNRLSERDPRPAHFIDVALRLLKPDTIERALRTLDVDTLRALRSSAQAIAPETALPQGAQTTGAQTATPETATLQSTSIEHSGLAVAGGTLPEVTEVLDQLWPATKSVSDVPDHRLDPAPGDHWAQTAFLAGQRAVLLLRGFDLVNAVVTRAGSLSVAAQKAIAEAVQIPIETMPHLWSATQTAGLAEVPDRVARATARGRAWARLPHAPRWLAIASAVLATMPAQLYATLDRGTNLAAAAARVPVQYPLIDSATRDAIDDFITLAETLGITEHGVLTRPAHLMMLAEPDEALNAARSAFPTVAPGVYLQPDLSVIAPGPLDPQAGHQLLDLTAMSNPGVATSMQLTRDSLAGALDRGWTTDEIRTVLGDLSLTPLPQPLEFLLDDLERLHGSVVVHSIESEHAQSTGHRSDQLSRITTASEGLTRELLANNRLDALELTPTSQATVLTSRLSAKHTHAILTEAGVAATFKREKSGTLSAGDRASEQRTSAPTDDELIAWLTDVPAAFASDGIPAWATELAATLVAAAEHAPEEAMIHAIELAIRTGDTLTLTIASGNASRQFTLQPLTITGSRLRALDPVAQLERTLSLSAITAVGLAPAID